MAIRKLAAAAATLLGVATPAFAADIGPTTAETTVLYYVRLPIDGFKTKEREASVGFFLRGKQDYQRFSLDTRVLNLIDGGIFEAKWLIVGAVGAGAAAAVGTKSKAESHQQAQQQAAQQQAAQQQAAQQPAPDPCVCYSYGGITYRNGLYLP